MKNFVFLILFGSFNVLLSQETFIFKGKIIDSEANPLEYVNVILRNKTTENAKSNSKGIFQIRCNKLDTLEFSIHGFESKRVPVNEFVNDKNELVTVHLDKKIKELQDVSVYMKSIKTKVKTYGSESKSKRIVMSLSASSVGMEFGIEIDLPEDKPVYIQEFSVNSPFITMDSIKLRLNLYQFKDGDSSNNLIPKSIVFTHKKGEHLIVIPLKEFNLRMTGSVFAFLEVIDTFGFGEMTFSVGLPHGSGISRLSHAHTWKKNSSEIVIPGVAFNLKCLVIEN